MPSMTHHHPAHRGPARALAIALAAALPLAAAPQRAAAQVVTIECTTTSTRTTSSTTCEEKPSSPDWGRILGIIAVGGAATWLALAIAKHAEQPQRAANAPAQRPHRPTPRLELAAHPGEDQRALLHLEWRW